MCVPNDNHWQPIQHPRVFPLDKAAQQKALSASAIKRHVKTTQAIEGLPLSSEIDDGKNVSNATSNDNRVEPFKGAKVPSRGNVDLPPIKEGH